MALIFDQNPNFGFYQHFFTPFSSEAWLVHLVIEQLKLQWIGFIFRQLRSCHSKGESFSLSRVYFWRRRKWSNWRVTGEMAEKNQALMMNIDARNALSSEQNLTRPNRGNFFLYLALLHNDVIIMSNRGNLQWGQNLASEVGPAAIVVRSFYVTLDLGSLYVGLGPWKYYHQKIFSDSNGNWNKPF